MTDMFTVTKDTGKTSIDLVQQTNTCSKLIIVTLKKRCEMSSKLTMKTVERRQRRVFFVNFEYFTQFSSVSIADLEEVNVCWAFSSLLFTLNIFSTLIYCFFV